MRLFELIRLGVKVMGLANLPDWSDSADTRRWCLSALDVGDMLADLTTGTTIDDDAMIAARSVVANDDQWRVVYSLLVDVFDGVPDVAPLPDNPRILAAADEAGISPSVIILIVDLAIQAFKLWRERRGGV